MKKLVSLALLGVLAAAPAFAQDLTLPQLIEKNNEARGGKAAWEAAKVVRVEGTFEMGPGMVAPFTLVFAQPNKMRMDFEIQGIKATQAFDGEGGWSQMPFMGSPDPQKASDDEIKQFRRMADFEGPLFNGEKKGYKLELLGKEDVEGTPAYKIKVTRDDEESTLFVDAEYFLEFKETRKITTEQGAEILMESSMGDYKTVGDIVFPHSILTKAQGAPQGQAVTLKKIEVNPGGIGDDFFKMPPPAPKPAEAKQ